MWRRLLISCLFPAISFAAQTGSFELGPASSFATATVQQNDRTVIDIQIARLDYEPVAVDGSNEFSLSLPDEFEMSRGAYLGPGEAVLPTITRLIAIPFDSEPVLHVTRSSYRELRDIHLVPASAEDRESLPASDAEVSQLFQTQIVSGEVAGVMRDLRIYAITVAPVQYNPEAGNVRVYDEIQIEISHPGTQMTWNGARISEAFAPIYRLIIDNVLVFDPIQITRGAYWIIYPDPFLTYVQPLADWKKAKGYAVELIPKSRISPMTYTGIKTYILARFDSCLVKPDYIVIVGDVTMPSGYGIPTRPYSNPYGTGSSDNYFTFLHGNDYFPEVLIGRISIRTTGDLQTYTDKLFSYERHPYRAQTHWYLHATVVAGSDGGNFISPRMTKLWCRERMMESGFTQVDTFFDSWGGQVYPSEINASIDAGVAYVNYRGYGAADYWVPPYYSTVDMAALSNGPMYPIMTSIVCGTGDFNSTTDPCFGEAWIRYANKGGPGFIGNTNHDAHTRWTNALDVGIYWGWFSEGITTLAQAQLMGKMNVYNAFPAYRNMNDQVDLYFNTYNDLGDPEVNCWTQVPSRLAASFPDSVPFGQNRVDVHVTNESGGALPGAAVCLWKGQDVFAVGFTGADGNFEFTINPQTPGNVALTVTARNFVPLEDTVSLSTGNVVVGYLSQIVDDDSTGESSGDGDAVANPSETIELPLILKNFGQSDTAFGVTATITSEYQGIESVRATASYGTIAPGDSASSVQPFLLHVLPDALNGVNAPLLIDIADTGGHHWQGITHLSIAAAQIVVDSVFVLNDDDGIIEPGETLDLVLKVIDSGPKAIRGTTAVLRTLDDAALIVDSTAVFGDCEPGNPAYNTDDRFTIQIRPETYVGHLLNFTLDFVGQGPQIVRSGFSEQVGVVRTYDPIGPDRYGYYCFDNTDTAYLCHPAYNWIVINTQGWPFVTLSDDDVATISLPFPVTYYGRIYDQITICDNGYVALGQTWWANFFNAPIPGPQDAESMIAPFWDDFTQTGLRVYYYDDLANSWLVIGWNNAYDGDTGRNQTFEIIILDEAAWPTLTHDNEIIFQYNLAQSPTTTSVGICSPDRRDGIQYLFDGHYTAGAPILNNGRAIKFTTGSLYTTVAEDKSHLPADVSLSQNYPNPFNPSTVIEFSIPNEEHIRIDIFNVLGQKVETLLDRQVPAGSHSVIWEAKDVTSGIYFYRLAAGDRIITRRMTVIK